MKVSHQFKGLLTGLCLLLSQNVFSFIIANNSGVDMHIRVRSGVDGSIKRLSEKITKGEDKSSVMINEETFLLKAGQAIDVPAMEFPLRIRSWPVGHTPKVDVDKEGIPTETCSENVKASIWAKKYDKEGDGGLRKDSMGLIIGKIGHKYSLTASSDKNDFRVFLKDRDKSLAEKVFEFNNYMTFDIQKFADPEKLDDEALMGVCAICTEALDASSAQIVTTKCHHHFHKKCMENMVAVLKKAPDCPMCRTKKCIDSL